MKNKPLLAALVLVIVLIVLVVYAASTKSPSADVLYPDATITDDGSVPSDVLDTTTPTDDSSGASLDTTLPTSTTSPNSAITVPAK